MPTAWNKPVSRAVVVNGETFVVSLDEKGFTLRRAGGRKTVNYTYEGLVVELAKLR